MNETTILLRDARPDEYDKIGILIRDAYAQYQPNIPPEAWHDYVHDQMDVRSRLNDSELIVAEAGGRLAGSVTLYLKPAEDSGWPKGWAGIRLLAVHPDFRGRGIGRALMEECLQRSRAAGIKTIGLHTNKMMTVAVRLYEKMGFVRVPELDFVPRPETVIMAYRLDLKKPR